MDCSYVAVISSCTPSFSVRFILGAYQQVGSLVVDVEARHAVDLCVDIRYEAETVLTFRSARYGERLEFIVEGCRIVANAHPLVLAVH